MAVDLSQLIEAGIYPNADAAIQRRVDATGHIDRVDALVLANSPRFHKMMRGRPLTGVARRGSASAPKPESISPYIRPTILREVEYVNVGA